MSSVVLDAPVFVDMQGFTARDKFIIKEAAILRKNGEELVHHVFEPPFSWNLLTRPEQIRACWLSVNHHKLSWNEGDVKYSLAKNIVRKAVNIAECTLVYVKGGEKKKWLFEILEELGDDGTKVESIDADFEEIGRLGDLAATRRSAYYCGRHRANCAMHNVCKLYDWWTRREAELDSL